METQQLSDREKSEYLTFGFIHECTDNNDYIPKAIKHLITSFMPNSLWMKSSILTAKEKDSLIEMIETHSITANKFKNCIWKNVMRASRDGYSPERFHEICDDVSNTVCFVETSFNHICGGYIETAWRDGKDGNWVIVDPNAFMFVLRPTQQTFDQINESWRKTSVGHYIGDAFGFGYNDLVLHNEQRGRCRRNGNYNFASAEQVAGGFSFKFNDYEIFQLIPFSS
eukprot:478414_1